MLTILQSCQEKAEATYAGIKEETIEKHIQELSSDAYLGRKPFTPGEVKTVAYLEEQLRSMGIEPGNGNSYRQEVPMVEIKGTSSDHMTLSKGNETLQLSHKEQFVTYSERLEEEISVEQSEVVFCGFGITAPEYDWNDFEGIDVKGKTVIVLVNDPGFGGDDDAFFKGNTMTYYGRWTYKYEEAARQGAAALLIVHETTSAGYPWFVVESSWSGGQLTLQPEDKNEGKAAIQGWLTLDAAKLIFENAGYDLGAEIRKARTDSFKPFSLGYKMSHSLTNEFKFDKSDNVIGKIEGTTRPDEVIIYSAHWDHLGVGQVVDGDSIYNGALDNASGTAGLLAIAEAFAAGPKPARSLVFLFVTAEEQGLLGSKYYAENPIFAPNLSVANLNIDGMNILGPMNYLTITGMGHSEMDEYAREAAAQQGRQIIGEQEPEKGYFFRSDHFSFAKVGIPALYATGDYEHSEKGKDYVKEMKENYVSTNYHRPSDHYVPDEWDLTGMVQDAQLYFNVGKRLAGENTFPKWKEGSEFKAARDQSALKN